MVKDKKNNEKELLELILLQQEQIKSLKSGKDEDKSIFALEIEKLKKDRNQKDEDIKALLDEETDDEFTTKIKELIEKEKK